MASAGSLLNAATMRDCRAGSGNQHDLAVSHFGARPARSSRSISSSRPTRAERRSAQRQNRLATVLGRNTCQAGTAAMPLTSTAPRSRTRDRHQPARARGDDESPARPGLANARRGWVFHRRPIAPGSILRQSDRRRPPVRWRSTARLEPGGFDIERPTASMAPSPARAARSASSSCACG